MTKELKSKLATAKLHNIMKEVTLYLLDDQLQRSNSNMRGSFQLSFYTNLFTSTPNS